MSPRWRAVLFLVLVNVAWIAAAWTWTEREHWLWITPIALSINFLLLTYDQVLSFSGLEAREIAGQDPWGILKTVHALRAKRDVPEPRIFLVPTERAHVFAYGRHRNRPRIYLTEGAVNLLSSAELEAVLAHQLLAGERGLTVLNYWVGAALDLLYRLGSGVERAFAFVFGWAPELSAWLMRPSIWLMDQLLLGRRDLEKLDRDTAAWLGRPDDLARALWKMDAYSRTRPWPEAWVFAHMCLINPRASRPQPELKPRLRLLAGRFPL